MSQSSVLYDEVILDHIKNARNYRTLDHADRIAEGINPLCGDSFTVYVLLEGEVIRDTSFQCSCCGISMASASVMTQAMKGKTIEQAKELNRRFTALVSESDKRHLLLPVMMFPLVVPVLVTVVQSTLLLTFGDPMGQGSAWTSLLTVFALLHWLLDGALYSRAVD